MTELLKYEDLPDVELDMEELQKNFCQWIMFSTIGRGKREYLCTRCGGKWKHDRYELKREYGPEDRFWDGVKINDRISCPKCGCVCLVKNRKTFTPGWKAIGMVFILPITKDYVTARCYLFEKYGDSAVNVENRIKKTETNLYHIREGEKALCFWSPYGDGKLKQTAHIIEPFSWNHGLYTEKYGYSAIFVENNGLKASDTFLRYFPDAQLQQEYMHERHYPVMKLICAYAEHPRQVETLAKVGQFEAIRALAEGTENVRTLDWTAITPWGIHRISKQVYDSWRKDGHSSLDTLKLYKHIKVDGIKGMEKAIEIEIGVCGLSYTRGLKKEKEIVTLGQQYNGRPDGFLKYIEKLTEKYNENTCLWGRVTERTVYQTWTDYRETAKKLGCADKVPKFPHDLKDRHDQLVQQWRKIEEKRRRKENEAYRKAEAERKKRMEEAEIKRREELELKYKGVRERYAQIAERYAYTDGTYSIVVPTGAADIQEEGYNLLHCTGTTERYFSRIISGESYIFFLRRAYKPKESWYTLEVEPGGTIRQKRTKYDEQNADLEEAIPFLRKWQEAITPRMNEEDLRAAMEAKRLRMLEFEELRRTDTRIRNGSLRGRSLADVLTADLMEAEPREVKQA